LYLDKKTSSNNHKSKELNKGTNDFCCPFCMAKIPSESFFCPVCGKQQIEKGDM